MIGSSVLNIVATGVKKPLCGDVRSIYEACSRDETHYKKFLPMSCNDRGCPTCYGKIIAKEAHKATDHLRQLHDEHLKNGHDLGVPVHLVLSPPQDARFADLSSFHDLRAQAYLFAQQIGMVGGCLVFHHKRGSSRDFKLLRKGIIDQDDLKTGPHFHIVGFMPRGHQVKSSDFYSETGWIYKTINFRVQKFATSYNVIRYELSHASYFSGRHMITWFGLCSYNNVRIETKVITEDCTCKVCGATVAKYSDGLYLNDQFRKKTIRRYSIPLNIVNRLAAKYLLPETPARSETLLAYAI